MIFSNIPVLSTAIANSLTNVFLTVAVTCLIPLYPPIREITSLGLSRLHRCVRYCSVGLLSMSSFTIINYSRNNSNKLIDHFISRLVFIKINSTLLFHYAATTKSLHHFASTRNSTDQCALSSGLTFNCNIPITALKYCLDQQGDLVILPRVIALSTARPELAGPHVLSAILDIQRVSKTKGACGNAPF